MKKYKHVKSEGRAEREGEKHKLAKLIAHASVSRTIKRKTPITKKQPACQGAKINPCKENRRLKKKGFNYSCAVDTRKVSCFALFGIGVCFYHVHGNISRKYQHTSKYSFFSIDDGGVTCEIIGTLRYSMTLGACPYERLLKCSPPHALQYSFSSINLHDNAMQLKSLLKVKHQ